MRARLPLRHRRHAVCPGCNATEQGEDPRIPRGFRTDPDGITLKSTVGVLQLFFDVHAQCSVSDLSIVTMRG